MTMAVRFGNTLVDKVPATGPVRLWDCGVEWARLQPTKHAYDFTKLDKLVSQLAGRDIMLVIGHPPLWAADGSDDLQAKWLLPGSNRPPVSDDDWSNYVLTVATRYKGKIKSYQVWNEPASKDFYSGDYATLARLVKRAKRLIHIADPAAKVVSPPLQPRKQAGWDGRGKKIYEALEAEGFPFHVWAAHIYPQVGEGTNAWVRDVRMVQNRVSGTNKPLWITETNFNVVGPGNPWTAEKQRTTLDTIRSRCYTLDIPRCYWYGFGHSDPSLFAITNT